jgi:hypothetical protein
MGVHQAGQNRFAAQVHYLSAGTLEIQKVGRRTDLLNPAVLDRDSLLNREPLIDRDDLSMVENKVGLLGKRVLAKAKPEKEASKRKGSNCGQKTSSMKDRLSRSVVQPPPEADSTVAVFDPPPPLPQPGCGFPLLN